MENPATWGPAEHIVRSVLDKYWKLQDDSDGPYCGMSLEMQITTALREAHLMKEVADDFGDSRDEAVR